MTATSSDVDSYRARIASSSFYTAMRLMPKVEREAMFAVYMFCRLVDDIADDGTRPRPARSAALAEWRRDLDALYAGQPAGQAGFLEEPVQAFGLRQADFLDVIRGMEMDVTADIRAPDLATLGLYCDRVAVAVGRLSTRVFGMEQAPGDELAHQLGRALQLTNILRDVREDLERGSCWLPRSRLAAHGLSAQTLLLPGNRARAVALLDELVDVALGECEQALEYALLLPAEEEGLRLFCLWPLFLAVATLGALRGNPEAFEPAPVKLGRAAVLELMALTR
jgi:phytoene/squalene synthetase